MNKSIAPNYPNVTAFYYLGLAFEKQNRNPEAITSFEKSIRDCLRLIDIAAKEQFIFKPAENKQGTIKDYVIRKTGKEIELALQGKERLEQLLSKESVNTTFGSEILIIEYFSGQNKIEINSDSEKTDQTELRLISSQEQRIQNNRGRKKPRAQ